MLFWVLLLNNDIRFGVGEVGGSGSATYMYYLWLALGEGSVPVITAIRYDEHKCLSNSNEKRPYILSWWLTTNSTCSKGEGEVRLS